MKGTMTILKVDGTKTVTEFDRAPTLEELQAAVGGFIEHVSGFDTYEGQPAWAVVNEDGKGSKLAVNVNATQLWETQSGFIGFDMLVGDVAILQGDDEFMEAL